MAEMTKSITVEVHPRLVADLDTAKVCMKLVDWFLEANEEYKLVGVGCEHEITTDAEQEHRFREYFNGRFDGAETDEERKKWRKLAGLEDE